MSGIFRRRSRIFQKSASVLEYGLHLDTVTSRWARELANEVGALDVTKNNCELLKYGLHLDAVISRWAREHCERGRCPRRYKKKAIYANISQFLFTFHQIPYKLSEHHKTYLGLRWGFCNIYAFGFFYIPIFEIHL